MTTSQAPGPSLGLGETRPGETRRFSHAAMATVFEIHCVHAQALYAAQAAQAAFALVDELEQLLSRFRENSDTSRINRLAAGETTQVSPSTMECLEVAWHVHELTVGSFDVSIGSGLRRLELHPDELRVHARDGGAQLDLGGIGKGYAVDRVAGLLEEWDLRHALVHGGFSSVLALEPPPGRDGWPLTLSAPGSAPGSGGNQERDRVLARFSARRTAWSASGIRKGDHIADTRSGLPVRWRAAWAAVPWREGEQAATLADALSTAFMLQPVEEIAALCRACPGLEAWVVPDSQEGGEGSVLVHMGAPAR